MIKVKKDKKGIFVRTGGYIFRPGKVNGYSHAYDMGDGNLKENDIVQAKHIAGSPLAKIKTSNKIIYWHSQNEEENKKTK